MESFYDIFKKFLSEWDFTRTIELYERTCSLLDVTSDDSNALVFRKFSEAARRAGVATDLFDSLDKVKADGVYGEGKICYSKRVSKEGTCTVHVLMK